MIIVIQPTGIFFKKTKEHKRNQKYNLGLISV